MGLLIDLISDVFQFFVKKEDLILLLRGTITNAVTVVLLA
jgi:hypothetical protein